MPKKKTPDCGTCHDDGHYMLDGGVCICGCDAGVRYRKKLPRAHVLKDAPIHHPIVLF